MRSISGKCDMVNVFTVKESGIVHTYLQSALPDSHEAALPISIYRRIDHDQSFHSA